jgi:tetratricopeptide (TPR) repeat protein
MITVEIRYIPGVGLVSRSPSADKAIQLLKKFTPNCEAVGNKQKRGIIFRTETASEAIQRCSDLAERLVTSGFFDALPFSLPFHGIIHDSQPPPEEIWQFVPQGSLLVPEHENIPGASYWLYKWQLVNFTKDRSVETSLFPLKSLMLLGNNKEECFFCGSHFHNNTECGSCWSPPPESCTVKRLASLAPNLWTEDLKLKRRENISITEGLQFLLQDMRRQFSWHYLLMICQTSANSFNELAFSPLTTGNSRTHDLANAIKHKNINSLHPLMEKWRKITGDSRVYLIKGLYYLHTGDVDRAMTAWWDAENSAPNALLKSYASILQSRVHLLAGNISAAEAYATRAYKTDNSPETLYWHIIFSILEEKRKKRHTDAMRLMSGSHTWLTSLVIDPLLLPYQQETEADFMEIFKEEETNLRKKINRLEKNIRHATEAFGPDITAETEIKLRDLLGKLGDMGLTEIRKSISSLEKMDQGLQRKINRKVATLLKNIPVLKKRCREIAGKLTSRKKKALSIKKECLEIITALNELSRKRGVTDPDEQKKLQTELATIEKQYKAMNRHYREYIEALWQFNLLKKYLTYGMFFTLMIWFAIYMSRFF